MTNAHARSGLVEVVTHCDDEAVLARIAEVLVEERLAACVHVTGPVSSTYRWQGDTCHEQEWELVAVTVVEREGAAMARLLEMHSYGLPSLVVRSVSASSDYELWVREHTDP